MVMRVLATLQVVIRERVSCVRSRQGALVGAHTGSIRTRAVMVVVVKVVLLLLWLLLL